MKLFSRSEIRSVWGSMKVDIFTTRFFVDPLAVPLVVLFSKIKWITPNKISIAALLSGGIGAYFFFLKNFTLGALGYYIFFLFDSIDGKLARVTSTFDPLGAFYDFAVDRIVISMMVFGMCISFIRLGMFSEFAFALGYILIFLLKDVLDLKWKESGVVKKCEMSGTSVRSGIFARYKIHFKPGQILSCFLVFILAPLSNAFVLFFGMAIVCVLFSIISNIGLPYLSYLRLTKGGK